MDALDSILLEAWDRVSAMLKRDRVEVLKRSQRRFKGVLTRPMREWCLVLRASDTRLAEPIANIEPWEAFQNGDSHTVYIDGQLVRRLTKPVTIPYPGVSYEEAARLLGRTKGTLYEWVRQGVFTVIRAPRFKYPRDGKPRGRPRSEPQFNFQGKRIGVQGKDGDGMPFIYTQTALDPNNFHGRAPHPVWGSLWQWLWKDFPLKYELVVQREPRTRIIRRRHDARVQFKGWEFICPGRLNADLQFTGCGRRCTYLYAPQTVWTLAKAIAGAADIGFDMPIDSGMAGQWHPGLADSIGNRLPRSFACKTCWGVRSACMANENGWNEFITHISGGLLYGSEVPRPLDICPFKRKKRPSTRRSKKIEHITADVRDAG